MNLTPEGLLLGDCHDVMIQLPQNFIDLIYVDPPFFSGRERLGEEGSFTDRWEDRQSYLDWLIPRLGAMWERLRDGGTLWVHLDHHAVHAVKVALDAVVGEENFRNEVVWCYNGGGVPARDFPRKHDTLLRYAKGKNFTFNTLRRPYKINTQSVGRHSTRAKEVKIDLEKGTPLTDWWEDIPTVTGWSVERTGFPTQKPLGLLDRIILTTSLPGDLVADFFCGSGTTLVSAGRLGRRYLGVDVSEGALAVASSRLKEAGLTGSPAEDDPPAGLP